MQLIGECFGGPLDGQQESADCGRFLVNCQRLDGKGREQIAVYVWRRWHEHLTSGCPHAWEPDQHWCFVGKANPIQKRKDDR